MAAHNNLGKKGEDLANIWMTEKGFTLLHRNWRHSHYEVDIIATRNNILHFIEVKTRRNNNFGHPEESIDTHKMESLMKAADEFLYLFPKWKRIQYDVLSIVMNSKGEGECFFIEDVYL